MRFDWQKFCRNNRVPFVTQGPNVARNHIGIKCPWCGAGDKSEHMGLCLDVRTPVWGCFRNAAHRGRHPARLIARLLNINMAAAAGMVDAELVNVDDFETAVAALQQPLADSRTAQAPTRTGPVSIPPEFRLLGNHPENRYESGVLAYLAGRGFGSTAADVARAFGLWYALTGEQAWRIIFPVRDDSGTLIGWTGRDTRKDARLRYKASHGLGKNVLLTFPPDEDFDVLVICEGPMDALKINVCGMPLGIYAVATMGTAFTGPQVAALSHMARGRRRTWALFDENALAQNLYLTDQIPTAQWFKLPDGFEDPGALPLPVATTVCESMTA